MPGDFLFHDGRPDLLRPWSVDLATAPLGDHGANAIARLADGATLEIARSELVSIAGQLALEHPENEGWTVEVFSLHDDTVGDVAAQASLVLMAAVGFILLMACVNVANLLLARAGGRRREIALRQALGAGRGRVAGQLLTESLVLACVGGALGLVAATWGYRAIVAILPATMPLVFRFDLDARVLAYTLVVTLGSALLFGLVPALRASSRSFGALKDGARAGRSRRAGRFGSVLVMLQTAMAAVLLIGGGLLMKSVAQMRAQDLGFEPENVLTMRMALPPAEYPSREAADAHWRQVTRLVDEIPGVVAAGTTQSHPLMGSNWGRPIRIAAQDQSMDQERSVRLTYASPGLFEALGIEMVRGRNLSAADDADAPRVVVVNQAFVDQYLGPADDPLAQTLLSGESWEAAVIGVAEDVVERAVDQAPGPTIYAPIAQADVRARSLVVKTVGDPLEMVPAVQEAVWSLDADLPLYRIQTMRDLLEDRVTGFATIGYLMGIFAMLSLILGAVGIYGVTAYATGQRTSEIGLRLAMGAERADVVRMVVGQGAGRALLGLVAGLGAALFIGGAMAGILVGVSPRDPAVFGVVATVLGVVSLTGLYIPAARAARIDPVEALTAD